MVTDDITWSNWNHQLTCYFNLFYQLLKVSWHSCSWNMVQLSKMCNCLPTALTKRRCNSSLGSATARSPSRSAPSTVRHKRPRWASSMFVASAASSCHLGLQFGWSGRKLRSSQAARNRQAMSKKSGPVTSGGAGSMAVVQNVSIRLEWSVWGFNRCAVFICFHYNVVLCGL